MSGPDHFERLLPGPINNEVLLMNSETRFWTPDKNSHLNNIIPPYYAEGKDFEVVDKYTWYFDSDKLLHRQMFKNKYRGFELKRYFFQSLHEIKLYRFYRGERCTESEIDFYFMTFNTLIIPPFKQIKSSIVPEFEFKRLYISKHDTFLQLKARIAGRVKAI